MPSTIKDVAQKAGVSIAAVSRVFNNSGYVKDEKRKLILDAAKELNYTTNASESKAYEKADKDIIGVVVADINNPFFSEAIKGINKVADQNRMNVIICDTDESPEREIRLLLALRRERVGGIIVTPASEAVEYNSEYLKELKSMGIPIVLLDRDVKLSGFDGVFLDSFKGTLNAVQTLIDNGHRNIAIIAGLITSKPGIDRLNGYMEAFRLNKLPIKEEHILYGDFKTESGYYLTNKLLDTRKDVTAIFSSNNLMSVGCLKAITERGLKIPDDISLISFDDFYLFELYGLAISAVARPTTQMGVEAATILMEKVKKGKKYKEQISKRIILTPHLVLRGSEVFPKNRLPEKL